MKRLGPLHVHEHSLSGLSGHETWRCPERPQNHVRLFVRTHEEIPTTLLTFEAKESKLKS